jgi:hypothetical protein
MIKVGSCWKTQIWTRGELSYQRVLTYIFVKVVDVCDGWVTVYDIFDKNNGTSMECPDLLKYYTEMTPLEVELL